ncbi:MAG TPA: HesA/MoeB/ThiF family protein [Candidatus Binataceae bacterium]|nr:HesA/MoeB/ThiF family protein [Candidatus Binataceae bacterium]
MPNLSILIIGAGGLGAPSAWTLARAGARITILDPDPVELSNLARQVIYRSEDIGAPKVLAGARRLRELFPRAAIDAHAIAFDASNGPALAAEHGFIIDATDDPAVKFLINDIACAADRPFVYGGVLGMTGQAMTIVPGRSACLRCLFEAPPDQGEIASCREAGIIGPVAGAIAELQAAEAMAYLHGAVPRLAGRILTYDATSAARFRITAVAARQGCGCGAARRATLVAAETAHQ